MANAGALITAAVVLARKIGAITLVTVKVTDVVATVAEVGRSPLVEAVPAVAEMKAAAVEVIAAMMTTRNRNR